MAKNENYFSHDYNARNDPKLLKLKMVHGHAGLGLYWILIEMLYEQGGTLNLDMLDVIAFQEQVDKTTLLSIVKDFGLFVNNGKEFCANFDMHEIDINKILHL